MSNTKKASPKVGPKKLALNAGAAAEKAARAAAENVLKAAEKAAIGAKQLKADVESKARDALDRSYLKQKPIAEENLTSLRKQHPEADPAELVLVLEQKYITAGAKSKADSTAFIEDTASYVLTLIEIYQIDVSHSPKIQRLVDQVVFVNSKPAKTVAEYGGIAVAFLFSKIPANAATKIGELINKLKNAKFVRKVLVAIPFLKKLGLDDWSSQAMGKSIARSVKKTLGPIPTSWPESKVSTRKPTAKKPAEKAKPSA